MKRVFSLFLIISALIAFSCSDDATGPSGGGLGGGGNGGGGVTFTMGAVQGSAQGQTIFTFKPSTAVVVTSVTFNCAAAGVNNQQVPDDGTTVYTSTNPDYFEVVDPNILAQGQKWSFTIAGKLGSSTGTAYSVAANCDI